MEVYQHSWLGRTFVAPGQPDGEADGEAQPRVAKGPNLVAFASFSFTFYSGFRGTEADIEFWEARKIDFSTDVGLQKNNRLGTPENLHQQDHGRGINGLGFRARWESDSIVFVTPMGNTDFPSMSHRWSFCKTEACIIRYGLDTGRRDVSVSRRDLP